MSVLEIKSVLRKCWIWHGGPWERWIEYANRNWTGFTEGLQGLQVMRDDETWGTRGIWPGEEKAWKGQLTSA